jgi:hypothetical protein
MSEKDTRRVFVALMNYADLKTRESRRRTYAGPDMAETRKGLRQDARAAENLARDIRAGHIALVDLRELL